MSAVSNTRQPLWKALGAFLMSLLILTGAGCIAFRCSPWPSVWVIRWMFARDGMAGNAALLVRVPPGVDAQTAISYDASDRHALLDIYRPAARKHEPLPVLVWIHGGGYVAGRRTDIANYARILAGDGYAVVAVDYPLAPEAQYPTPVAALNRALAFLSEHAAQLQLKRNRFVLAGDSAGAQLAAQIALIVASPGYAKAMGMQPGIDRSQLAGVVLYCGPFDARSIVQETASSWYSRAFVWSYFGTLHPSASAMNTFSIAPNVVANFPPTFINVGNVDVLAPQSYALASALQRQGTAVETMFFPPEHTPPLDHEYEFDLSVPDANETLQRTRVFIRRVLVAKGNP